MAADDDTLGRKCALEHRYGALRLGIAAHEHIERSVVSLGPAMNADMGLGEHRYTGYPATWFEMMEMDVEQRRPTLGDAIPKSTFHMGHIIEARRPPEIDDEVMARKLDTVLLNEVVCGFRCLRGVNGLVRQYGNLPGEIENLDSDGRDCAHCLVLPGCCAFSGNP